MIIETICDGLRGTAVAEGATLQLEHGSGFTMTTEELVLNGRGVNDADDEIYRDGDPNNAVATVSCELVYDDPWLLILSC